MWRIQRFEHKRKELVSKVAYRLGVPKRIFDSEHEPPKLEVYERLEKDKNARIIRNLSIIRTSIIRNYKNIKDKISYLMNLLKEYVMSRMSARFVAQKVGMTTQ